MTAGRCADMGLLGLLVLTPLVSSVIIDLAIFSHPHLLPVRICSFVHLLFQKGK